MILPPNSNVPSHMAPPPQYQKYPQQQPSHQWMSQPYFGRHFTKIEKLKEIVDVLHWYIQDGDMLVDFCCGSNDFSCLSKRKLDEVRRRCSFKNYDIIQAKDDFSFERRDWMGVRPNELPDGSRLIIGLNPPFGVNGVLANKFIDKALEFKPKLLILIVPRETHRLDEKKFPYDLIWEDDQMFSGKSFYLPGSVDVHDNQIEDWNNTAPVLYLWSHPDWTSKHKDIAVRHGHSSGDLKKNSLEEIHHEMNSFIPKQECHNLERYQFPGREVPISGNRRPEHLSRPGPRIPYPSRPLNAAAIPFYGRMNSSAMNRYATRLDELNRIHMNTMVPRARVPDSIVNYLPPVARPGYQGFPPGPYHP